MPLPRAATGLAITLSLGVIALSGTGCAVIRAAFSPNESPVDQKSREYGLLDLSRDNADWRRLDGSDLPDKEIETGVSDVAFQSKKHHSIITLNSSCRKGASAAEAPEDRDRELKQLTRLLTLGFRNISKREEQPLIVSDLPALQTTVQGELPDDPARLRQTGVPKYVPMVLRAVVLRRKQCTYDMVYLAGPEDFAVYEGDFDRFVKSLRLR